MVKILTVEQWCLRPGNGETDCSDGIDNDGDDAIDGEDPDCSGLPPNERETIL